MTNVLFEGEICQDRTLLHCLSHCLVAVIHTVTINTSFTKQLLFNKHEEINNQSDEEVESLSLSLLPQLQLSS